MASVGYNIQLSANSLTVLYLTYARKFPWYVIFADFTVTYGYSENLIREILLVCNNQRFVTVHNILPFRDGPVIRENIIVKILFASCSAKISYRENFRVYGNTLRQIINNNIGNSYNSTDPCVILEVTNTGEELTPSCTTFCVHLERKD